MEHCENTKDEQENFDRAASFISEEKNTEAKAILQNTYLHLKTGTAEKLTLLHIAVSSGNKDMTQHLIDLGSNVDAQTTSGHTPLMLAVQKQNLPIVVMLLETNTNLDILDKNGKTAFDIASSMQRNGGLADIGLRILVRPVERAGGFYVDPYLFPRHNRHKYT